MEKGVENQGAIQGRNLKNKQAERVGGEVREVKGMAKRKKENAREREREGRERGGKLRKKRDGDDS